MEDSNYRTVARRQTSIPRRAAASIRVPIGVEKVLCRAAADPAFCSELIEHRSAALLPLSGALSPAELAILNTVPAATLEAMLHSIDLHRHPQRPFMKAVVAAALIAAAGTGVVGCLQGCACTGIAPDDPDQLRAQEIVDDRIAADRDMEAEEASDETGDETGDGGKTHD